MLKGFDYKKTAPARDTEFARPPRGPQRRGCKVGVRKGSNTEGKSAKEQNHRRPEDPKTGSGEVQRQPQRGTVLRSPAPAFLRFNGV